jgi:hypothetical protein
MTTIRKLLTRLSFWLLALPSVTVAQEAPAPLRLESAVELAAQNPRSPESALGRKSLSRFPPFRVKPSRALSRASATRLTRRRAQCRSSSM